MRRDSVTYAEERSGNHLGMEAENGLSEADLVS